MLENPQSNITDLFFFPQGDRMILILDVRRSLREAKPYALDPLTYQINMDFSTPLSFESAENRARYGAAVPQPEKIHPDATITLRLRNNVTLNEISFNNLKDTDKIELFVGVRDDPFVFPRFFAKNTISMVMSIPMSAFPAGQRDFILWATASQDGKVTDHVGRSLRTQLPRFGFLNDLPPSEHVKKLMERRKFLDGIYNFLRDKKESTPRAIADLLQFTFLIRPYDIAPDVLIYSNRYPAGYPNGRLLTDDVVAQTCATGDCLLQEISFIESKDVWPRATVNDKPISANWPMLAEPWDNEQEVAPTASIWPYVVGVVIIVALAFWAVVEIIRRFVLLLWHRIRRKAAPAV